MYKENIFRFLIDANISSFRIEKYSKHVFFQDLMFSLQTPVAKFGHQSQQDFFLLQENCFLCTVQCWAM